MKNVKLLTLLILSTVLFAISCSDDDDNDIDLTGSFEAFSLDVDCPNDNDSFSTTTTATEDLCITVGTTKTTAVVLFVFEGQNYTTWFIETDQAGMIDTVQTTGVFDINNPDSRVNIIGIDGEVSASDDGNQLTFEGTNGGDCDVTLMLGRI